MFAISPLIVLITLLTSAVATKATTQAEAERKAAQVATAQCEIVPGPGRDTGAAGHGGKTPGLERTCPEKPGHPRPAASR